MRSSRYKLLGRETGWYASDAALQWWYFDAEFSSGHRMMTVTMPRMVGDVNEDDNGPVPGVTLVIMDPEGRNHHTHAFYPGDFEGGGDRMFARFGGSTIQGDGDRYRVSFRQDGLGFDLGYEPELPPWPPFPGRGGFMMKPLVWAMAPGKYMNYASMVPRGKVTGRLILPDGEVAVAGEGYHEQGRTDAPIQRLFNSWYWTRFFVGEWTFIFPAARAPRRMLNKTMHALLIYRGREPVFDFFDVTGMVLRHEVLERQTSEAGGRSDVPRRAVFSARWPGLRLRVEMDIFHELEAFRFKPFAGSTPEQPAWLQHVMNVAIEMSLDGQRHSMEGQGVFESMYTGAA